MNTTIKAFRDSEANIEGRVVDCGDVFVAELFDLDAGQVFPCVTRFPKTLEGALDYATKEARTMAGLWAVEVTE